MTNTDKFLKAFAVFMLAGSVALFAWVLFFNGRGSEDNAEFFLFLLGVPGIVAFIFYRHPAPFVKAFNRLLSRE